MKIEIEDLKKFQIGPQDTLVVHIDVENLPLGQAKKKMRDTLKFFRDYLDSENLYTTQVMVLPSDVKLSVATK